MAYWGVAMDFLGNTLATTPTRADAQAAWEALEKARAAGAKTQRERDWIEALSAYFRDHDKVAVDARLAAYNAAMERMAQSYPDDYEAQVLLCADASGLGAEKRPDLCQPDQIRGASGETLRAEPAASGRDALPHSRLRLCAACREGNCVGAALCWHCAGRAARAAHAVAHLLHGRTLGRIHRLERVGARDPARLLSCVGFYGLCASAARAGCQGRCDDQEVARHRRPRRSSDQLRQFHRQGRDAGALRPGTGGLGRRCRAADDRQPISAWRIR